MTEREKIIDVLNKNFTQDVECTPIYTTAQGKEVALPQELCDIFNDIVTQAVIPCFADALIAAEIGDVSELKKHRVVVEKSLIPEDDNTYALPNTPIRVKQLYSGEEVEQIVKERDEYKHRAEVAEMTLKFVCRTQENLNILVDGKPWTKEEIYNRYIEQAKKELTEEKKDD